MKQKKYKIILSFICIVFIYYSCTKEMHQNDLSEVENKEAVTGMDYAFANMAFYNDSLNNDHNNSHAKQNHDLKYHHHDSIYNHYHNDFHHGDTTHHNNNHHTQNHHDQHDSLNLIHHKNHH